MPHSNDKRNLPDDNNTPNILIVEDNRDSLTVMSRLFESTGAHVTGVQHPNKSLEVIKKIEQEKRHLDMIVIDIHMPEMNGYQLARELRSQGYRGPIVAFTVNATGEGQKESMASGIDKYFSKMTMRKALVDVLVEQYCNYHPV
ncbi:MAG: response regulator [Candidatus Dadabacteria bacterium]|nr:MAG: response regulator [Candidatus Dadabacteria bacterium]